MNKYVFLFRLAWPYAPAWLAALLGMGIFTLCNTVSVMGLIPLIDRVLSNKPIRIQLSVTIPWEDSLNAFLDHLNGWDPLFLLKMICIFLVVITLVKGIAQFLQDVLMEWVSQKIARDMRCRLFNKFFVLPPAYFVGSRTGELITRITADVNLVQNMFSGRFTNSILDTLHFFPFLGIVILMEWRMALICAVFIPFVMTPILLLGRQIRKFSRKTLENLADVSSNIHEIVGALKIVKIFGRTRQEMEKFRFLCDKAVTIRLRSQKKEAIMSPLTEMIGIMTGSILLWWFAPKVLHGEMTLGTFFTYFTCIACLIKPIKTFSKVMATIQNSMAGADRIFNLLDQPEQKSELAGEITEVHLQEQIRFDQVTYSYQAGVCVLQDISFEMKKGTILALVGPSGSGKSTLAGMIPRFLDPDSGQVCLDGRDMRELHVSSIRQIMALVTQETILFNTTIHENIAYGKPEATREEVVEAAKLARAHEFIEKMEKGYETVIGERGIRLSGGEKQRIAIARALLKNPEILIFDEATSSLDTENEHLVQEAIDRVMENRTVLIIAHRLSTVIQAHQILVLDNGRIVQRGRHADLVKEPGLYKKLYEMNFEA